jgi:hypothetical protein
MCHASLEQTFEAPESTEYQPVKSCLKFPYMVDPNTGVAML